MNSATSSIMHGTAAIASTQAAMNSLSASAESPVSFLRETKQLMTDVTYAKLSASQLAGYGAVLGGAGLLLAGTGVLIFGVSHLVDTIKRNFFMRRRRNPSSSSSSSSSAALASKSVDVDGEGDVSMDGDIGIMEHPNHHQVTPPETPLSTPRTASLVGRAAGASVDVVGNGRHASRQNGSIGSSPSSSSSSSSRKSKH
jgi:hypothetical protein